MTRPHRGWGEPLLVVVLAFLVTACAEKPRARWTFEIGAAPTPGGPPVPPLTPAELARLPERVLERVPEEDRRATQVVLADEHTLVVEGPFTLDGTDPRDSFALRLERSSTFELLVEVGCAALPSTVDPVVEREKLLAWIASHSGAPLTEYDAVSVDAGGPPRGHVWRALSGVEPLETRARLFVVPEPAFTERDLGLAEPSTDSRGRPALGLEIARERQREFAELTERLIGCSLAIVIDGEVRTLASVRSRLGGPFVVEDSQRGFTKAEIDELVRTLPGGGLGTQLRFLKREYLPPR